MLLAGVSTLAQVHALIPLNHGILGVIRSTTVDENGFYFFDSMWPGYYTVEQRFRGWRTSGRTTADLTRDGEVVQADVGLIGTGTVSGTVRDFAGTVAGAIVKLSARSTIGTYFNATMSTDANGNYAFDSVPVGDVAVGAKEAVTELAGAASGRLEAAGHDFQP